MYALHIHIYGDIYPCTQPVMHIYIYIYMQYKTLNNHAQATDAAGSCSKHIIMIQKSPPEATKSFYQEIS